MLSPQFRKDRCNALSDAKAPSGGETFYSGLTEHKFIGDEALVLLIEKS